MFDFLERLSGRTKIGYIAGVVIALLTLLLNQMGLTATVLTIPLAFPGIFISMLVSGNVHAPPLWIAAIANGIFYIVLARLIGRLIDRFKRRHTIL